MLEDLRDYGIVYQRKRGSRRYYPTRLATTLTSGNAALAVAAMKRGGKVEDDDESDQGFVILETNYRVYAYTGMGSKTCNNTTTTTTDVIICQNLLYKSLYLIYLCNSNHGFKTWLLVSLRVTVYGMH